MLPVGLPSTAWQRSSPGQPRAGSVVPAGPGGPRQPVPATNEQLFSGPGGPGGLCAPQGRGSVEQGRELLQPGLKPVPLVTPSN